MSGNIPVNPNQFPAPMGPFEFLADDENRLRFLEALFYEKERYGRVVELEFSPEGLKVYYGGGLIATIVDACIGRYQDTALLLVSRRLMQLLGVPREAIESILHSCSCFDDFLVIVSRKDPRTLVDLVRHVLHLEPSWSWWREK